MNLSKYIFLAAFVLALPPQLELDKPTNKTGGLYISFKIQQSASASVIGQRPNFTIADYSAWADCENCSFGHCLVNSISTLTYSLQI